MSNDLSQVTGQSIREMIPSLQAESLEFITDLVKEKNLHRILEIGSGNARTALELAGLSRDIRVYTIERDPDMIEKAAANIENSGLKDQICLIAEDALELDLDRLPDQFDLIFIDGAKSQYRRFFERYSPLLAPGGRIITDNMYFHGLVFHPWTSPNRRTRSLMKKLLEYHEFLSQQTTFETEWLDIGDGIACSRRK